MYELSMYYLRSLICTNDACSTARGAVNSSAAGRRAAGGHRYVVLDAALLRDLTLCTRLLSRQSVLRQRCFHPLVCILLRRALMFEYVW